MIPYKQLSLADTFENCQEILDSDKPVFLSLLENHIDLDSIIPISFRNHFYASTGRTLKYSFHSMLWALIIQRIFFYSHRRSIISFLELFKRASWISAVFPKSLMLLKSRALNRTSWQTYYQFLKIL